MGECGIRKSDNAEIKIGTCESNYYVRLEDKDKVIPDEYSGFGWFWRLPLPKEDGLRPGDYKSHIATVPLIDENHNPPSFEDLKPGTLQMTHPCGLLANIPCYHGERLPGKIGNDNPNDIKFFWNGKDSQFYELRFLKTEKTGRVKPVVWCKVCHNMWSFGWEDIWEYIPDDLKPRFLTYKEV